MSIFLRVDTILVYGFREENTVSTIVFDYGRLR